MNNFYVKSIITGEDDFGKELRLKTNLLTEGALSYVDEEGVTIAEFI
jgi:hypothetical protein